MSDLTNGQLDILMNLTVCRDTLADLHALLMCLDLALSAPELHKNGVWLSTLVGCLIAHADSIRDELRAADSKVRKQAL